MTIKLVVIVPCSARKSVPVPETARACALPWGAQSMVAHAWLARLAELEPVCTAGALYAGRAFGIARQACNVAGTRLFVASAGLGLVSAEQIVPAYGISVSAPGSPDDVAARVDGKFSSSAWGTSIAANSHAMQLAEIDADLIIMALTGPYVELMYSELAGLPPAHVHRIRVLGQGAMRRLPPNMHRQVMPYERPTLDARVPGTGFDFPARALAHFLSEILPPAPDGNADAHARLVAASLAASVPPILPKVTHPQRSARGLLF